MPKSSSLSLASKGKGVKGAKDNISAPLSPESPTSSSIPEHSEYLSPPGPFPKTTRLHASTQSNKDSKSMISNFAATRSSSRLNCQDATIHNVANLQSSPSLYANRRSGSTPDLGRPVRTPNSDDNCSDIVQLNSRNGPGLSTELTDQHGDTSKRNMTKPKKHGLLLRSKSIKGNETFETRSKLNKVPPSQLSPTIVGAWTTVGHAAQLRVAPMEKSHSWRQNMGIGKLRTHSADRQDAAKDLQGEGDHTSRRNQADQFPPAPNSYNDNRVPSIMSSLGSGARKMGEKMDSARKGVFGKLGRSSSHHESQISVSNEPYVCKIIHKPLIEQTRLTRISTHLEQSRDKTEFWMPALPWRCIDYLNMRGCEEEGLYRVPGSAQQVRYYERKFDQDRDIDLISDPNLNDPNVIGSLFKNWLRQLPDEIFPKVIQTAIQQECQGAKTTPQKLKDELSRLPPFNYYLLFAITCHISLLHSCSEFNKMNYNNLCICFQPAIKIDAFCFQFLILDWRNCWQGCWTEKDFLADELNILRGLKTEGQQRQHTNRQQLGQDELEQKPSTPNENGVVQADNMKGSGQSSFSNQPVLSMATRRSSTDIAKPSSKTLPMDPNGAGTNFQSSTPSSESTHVASSRLWREDGETNTECCVPPVEHREATYAGELSRLSFEGDSGATPAHAQNDHGLSEMTQFCLDLHDTPSSPFHIRF